MDLEMLNTLFIAARENTEMYGKRGWELYWQR